MLGSFALALSLSTALIAMLAYGVSLRRQDPRLVVIGRVGFHVSVISFLVASATLLYLILDHQYTYTYIFEHSSPNLSRPLQIASFYAGQEGSFMLWTLMTALIGVFVYSYAQRVGYEREVMAPLTLVLSALLVILIVKSPFHTIWQSYPEQNIPADLVPTNPRGLNPSLENLWITIHPPILFMGFAAMTVPFVFAVAGLLRRDYQRWVAISLPWVLFASMALGFGIMLGGWWAYETLGWGGFWAWDPVENSSLIPWLSCVALLHTMLVQKKTGSVPTAKGGELRVGGLVRTNFVLAIVSFGLILYSTFLTRSGVLGDTSVHSFVSPGGFVYAVLVGIIILFLGVGFGMLARRWKELGSSPFNFPITSRENALALGSGVLLASAFVVLFGTSLPLLLPLVGKPKIAIDTDFYNGLHLPIAIALLLVNAASMRLRWKQTDPATFARGIGISAVIALIGTIGLLLLGITDPIYVALGFASLLALAVNVQIALRVARGNLRFLGAYVSHSGVAVMMLGIIFTARYSQTQHVQLVQGESSNAFGYRVTYVGSERIELEKTDREKYAHRITLEKEGEKVEVRPVTFLSDFNQRQSPFLEPGILYTPTRDIYIAPKALDRVGGDPTAVLRKGEKAVVPFDSSISVELERYDMSRGASENLQGAVMTIRHGDSSWSLTSFRSLSDGSYRSVTVPGTDVRVGFGNMIVDQKELARSQAVLVFQSPAYTPPPAKPVITVDVSIKPFISLVWAGVIIMVGGFFFSIIRRRREVIQVVGVREKLAPVPTPAADPDVAAARSRS